MSLVVLDLSITTIVPSVKLTVALPSSSTLTVASELVALTAASILPFSLSSSLVYKSRPRPTAILVAGSLTLLEAALMLLIRSLIACSRSLAALSTSSCEVGLLFAVLALFKASWKAFLAAVVARLYCSVFP